MSSAASSVMLEFGDLIRSRSNSFRQNCRSKKGSRASSRRASSSQSSTSSRPTSPEKMSSSYKDVHVMPPLGMFLIVPAVHSKSHSVY